MTLTEMRTLDPDTLKTKIILRKKELNKLKLQHAVRPLEDTSKLRNLRKEISQLYTILNSSQQ